MTRIENIDELTGRKAKRKATEYLATRPITEKKWAKLSDYFKVRRNADYWIEVPIDATKEQILSKFKNNPLTETLEAK